MIDAYQSFPITGQVVRTGDNMTLNPDNMSNVNHRADLVKIPAN